MKKNKLKKNKLPEGIEASSLVDISKLNLSEKATNRISMKISESVLSEYASVDKPSSVVIAGRISDIFKIKDITWVGIIVPDMNILREKGFSNLNNSIPKLLENEGIGR